MKKRNIKIACGLSVAFYASVILMGCIQNVKVGEKVENPVVTTATTFETTTGTSAIVTSEPVTSGVTTSVTTFTTTEETTATETCSEVYEETVYREEIHEVYVESAPETEAPVVVENPVESVESYGSVYSVSSLERDYLIHMVHNEAGNQSYYAKKGEATVCFNRCSAKNMGVIEVLTEAGQYSISFSSLDYCEECAEAVDDVLENGTNMPSDVMFAFSRYCNSSWLWGREIYCIDGDVVFAK